VGLETVVSSKDGLDCFLWFVEVFYDRVSVAFCRGSIHNDIVILVHFLQKLVAIWPYIKLEHVFPDLQSNIRLLNVSNRVNQGLVEVQDEQFLSEIELYKMSKNLPSPGKETSKMDSFLFSM
jgi:hypothetical protein